MAKSAGDYDIFLSHEYQDSPWVATLAAKLDAFGLRVFVNQEEIHVGGKGILRLSDGLENSRYMVQVLSDHTVDRDWVAQEWTSFAGGHDPMGRLLSIRIDAVELPTILHATQVIDGVDRDAERAAAEILRIVGAPTILSSTDDRRLVLGRDLVLTLSRENDELVVLWPDGEVRRSTLPWKKDKAFRDAYLDFFEPQRKASIERAGRGDLLRHAKLIGSCLFEVLFDDEDARTLRKIIGADRTRPVIQLCFDDRLLHALPWELLCHGDRFLLREGEIDLLRSTADEADIATLLKEPTEPFKLVVNVAAPENSRLDYESESYRISLATAGCRAIVPTELGTLDDLVETVAREAPQGIHFSGQSMPGALLFENDEGRDHEVPVQDLIANIRKNLPDEHSLPAFFYLASVDGIKSVDFDADELGSSDAALHLHRAGVSQVVGYFGPIADELSTCVEETLYGAIASGKTTRDAVRAARLRLAEPLHADDAGHQPARVGLAEAPAAAFEAAIDAHPFAWAQLVFYHRGLEWPLSIESGKRGHGDLFKRSFKRSFEGGGDRRVLRVGFIGRRREQQAVRRRLRAGARAFVFQGLAGLGKSTLAEETLPRLTDSDRNICTLWCQEAAKSEGSLADALVAQLLAYCRKRFGLEWEQVVQQVDPVAGDDPAERFRYFLEILVQNAPGLVLYLDNLETLLVGPDDDLNAVAFGQWAQPALAEIWQHAARTAHDAENVYLVASSRYRHLDFGDALLPVSPLSPDALFRLTARFQSLQRLHARTRARLVARLDGHPRGVDYADDLVAKALAGWQDRHGAWTLSTPPGDAEIAKEWHDLVEPVLPKNAGKLRDSLLLQAIWDKVLDPGARRFLCRMSVLRKPVEWSLLGLLGDQHEAEASALETAQRLRDTSLFERLELCVQTGEDEVGLVTRYQLHPATAQFINEAHQPNRNDLLLGAHRRLGEHLEVEANTSPHIETSIEAGYYLFKAGDYRRALQRLGQTSQWLQNHGRVREGLKLLQPFLAEDVLSKMERRLQGQLLGTIALAHYRLDEVEKAVCYFEQRLAIAREVGDRQGEGLALGNLGLAYTRLDDLEKAISTYEQVLVISRETGDLRGKGNTFGNLGNAYARLGETKKAIAFHEQALAISREIGDRQAEGLDLHNLGNVYADLGEADKATGYYDQALAIGRAINDPRLIELCETGQANLSKLS
ncbi:MAG: tetratricopeptide repeat protein [Geminicoccales bacterium]